MKFILVLAASIVLFANLAIAKSPTKLTPVIKVNCKDKFQQNEWANWMTKPVISEETETTITASFSTYYGKCFNSKPAYSKMKNPILSIWFEHKWKMPGCATS